MTIVFAERKAVDTPVLEMARRLSALPHLTREEALNVVGDIADSILAGCPVPEQVLQRGETPIRDTTSK